MAPENFKEVRTMDLNLDFIPKFVTFYCDHCDIDFNTVRWEVKPNRFSGILLYNCLIAKCPECGEECCTQKWEEFRKKYLQEELDKAKNSQDS